MSQMKTIFDQQKQYDLFLEIIFHKFFWKNNYISQRIK